MFSFKAIQTVYGVRSGQKKPVAVRKRPPTEEKFKFADLSFQERRKQAQERKEAEERRPREASGSSRKKLLTYSIGTRDQEVARISSFPTHEGRVVGSRLRELLPKSSDLGKSDFFVGK